MIRNDGKLICDREIGHYSRGWHSCKRGAIFSLPSRHSAGMFLDYCARHALLSAKASANLGKRVTPAVTPAKPA